MVIAENRRYNYKIIVYERNCQLTEIRTVLTESRTLISRCSSFANYQPDIYSIYNFAIYPGKVRSRVMRLEFVFSRRQEIYGFLETNVHILFC